MVPQPFQAVSARFRLTEGLCGIFTVAVQGFNCKMDLNDKKAVT